MVKKGTGVLIALLILISNMLLPVSATQQPQKTWLVAGDSITSDYYCRGYKKYDDYLEYYFNIEKGEHINFVKTAVPGFKVEDYLNNFDDMLGKYNAEIVSVFLGTNNKSDTEAEFTEKYRTLIERIVPSAENVAKGVPENRKTILFAPIPLNSGGQINKLTQIVAGIETVALEMAEQGYNITYIDLSSVFDNIEYGEGANLPSFSDYYEADAYHPNRFGHIEIAKTMLNEMGITDSRVLQLNPKTVQESEKKPDFKADMQRGTRRADFTDINQAVTDINKGFFSGFSSEASYDSILVAGGPVTAGKTASAGFCQTYSDLIRMKIRNDSKFQNKRIIDVSGDGVDVKEIAETISGQMDAYPDVKCAVVMPEVPQLYTGNGENAISVEEYKNYITQIIEAAHSRGVALMLLTPAAGAKRSNNLVLEGYAEALIDCAEEAYSADSNIKLYVANVFHVLKPIADVPYLSETYYDAEGNLKDSAHILIYLTAMQEKIENLTNMNVLVNQDTTLTSTETIQFLQGYYAEKAQKAFDQLDLSVYSSENQTLLKEIATQGIKEISNGTIGYRIQNSYETFLKTIDSVKTKDGSAPFVYLSAQSGRAYVSTPVDKITSIVIGVFQEDNLKDSFVMKNIKLQKGEIYETDTGLSITEEDDVKIIESSDLEDGELTPRMSGAVYFGGETDIPYSMLLQDGNLKAFTLSYDDALLSDEKLINMLDRYGIKGTFNAISGKLGGEQSNHALLELNDVKRVYQEHEVSMHGYTHLPLRDGNITAENIESEITKDRNRITALTGTEPVGYAYPGGAGWDNEFVLQQLRLNGVMYARPVATTGNFTLPDDFLAWKMTCHHNSAQNYVESFLEDTDEVKVFSVWGHTYEFNESQPKTWDKMEELLSQVSGKSDIWYATNREIAEYTLAYRNLVPIDGEAAVFNPTDKDVFVKTEGEALLVKPNSITPLSGAKKMNAEALTADQAEMMKKLLKKCISAELDASGKVTLVSPFSYRADIIIAGYDSGMKLSGIKLVSGAYVAENTPYLADVSSILTEKTALLKIISLENISNMKPVADMVAISVKNGN